MGNGKQKISLPIFKELVKNSFRLTEMIWKEKKSQILLLAFISLLVSATPFLQSASHALLINELVNIAGSGKVNTYLFWLVALLIFPNYFGFI